jgi:ubiquinone/menaquinone biosynthesis C-methylase UbiE
MSERDPAADADARALSVAGAYDQWAEYYDGDANVTRDLDALVIRRAPLRVAGHDVLEVGCGTGKNTSWLANSARHVIAMDFSNGMLEQARRRVSAANVSFVRHDVRHPWPVPDRTVDIVVANLVLEHVYDLAPLFAESARVLRAGGQLFVCELHPFRQLRGSQAQFIDPHTGNTVRVPAFRHSVSEYVNAALAAGFVLHEIGEWPDEGLADGEPPRLLSVLLAVGQLA